MLNKINPYTLCFREDDQEAAYQYHYVEKVLWQIRIAVFFGFTLYSLFGFLDPWIVAKSLDIIWAIRFIVCCVILLFLWFTYTSHIYKHLHSGITVVLISAGIGIIIMVTVADQNGGYLYYAGILLVIMMTTFMGLRFIYALGVCVFLLIAYEIVIIGFKQTPVYIVLNNSFFIVSTIIIGLLGCYLIEYSSRKMFNQNQIIDEERKKAEKANLTLETVFNSSIPICITSVDYDILKANDAYYSIWPEGKGSEEAVKCYKSRPGPPCNTDDCPLRQIIGGKDEVICETSKGLGVRQGEFIVTARPYRDIDGKLIGIVFSFQDISERKISEIALASERERLAVTLQSIGDGVITTDLDGKIVLINKISELLTGWSQQEAIGRPVEQVFNIINEKTGKLCDNPVDAVLSSGKIVGLANHTALIARDGTQYSIEDSGAPIYDNENKMIGVVLVFRDVTEAKRTAEKFLKIKKLESLGVLAGGIAHDFNNILVAILGNIELAGMYVDSSSEAYPLLKEAKEASLRAKGLTQQLLTFSKGGEPVKQKTPIGDTIIESANFVLRGSSISCQFTIPEDLWLVDIDSGQISQVIQNLVLNAKQSMPEGGQIKVSCTNNTDIVPETLGNSADKQYIRISVEDTGYGISDEHLDKIFDPYFTTKKEGSGLGLAISYSIIRKHEGEITVQSKRGGGTVFSIYLPISSEQKTRDLSLTDSIPEMNKAKILIMDDEPIVLRSAKQMLNFLGHEVLLAENGNEAIEIFIEQRKNGTPVDLIILDLTVPGGMGGKEAVEEIVNIDPEAKVIVTSGYSNDPILANCQQYKFKTAITKPFLMEELDKAISDALS